MALLPDKDHMEKIEKECLRLFDAGEMIPAVDLTNRLMQLEGLPMHCPYHHFLVPAALLTSAHMYQGSTREKLEKDLGKASERAGSIQGGICGNYGCCGAAVGAGIFASIWQGTTPLSKSGWAACNEMTARALSAIAGVEGPRCCKRVSFLSVLSAVTGARELLGVELGESRIPTCSFSANSRECRKDACPFYQGTDPRE